MVLSLKLLLDLKVKTGCFRPNPLILSSPVSAPWRVPWASTQIPTMPLNKLHSLRESLSLCKLPFPYL